MAHDERNETIEIVGRRATLYRPSFSPGQPKEKDWETKLSDLAEKIAEVQTFGSEIATPILPLGTKFYCKSGIKQLVIMEQPPQTRTISWTGWTLNGQADTYTVSFPYIIFVLPFDEGFVGLYEPSPQCFYRNKPLTSLKDKLYRTNLKNVRSDQSICLHPTKVQTKEGLLGGSELFLKEFWNETFNDSVGGGSNYQNCPDDRVSCVESWEAESAKNPLFVLSVNWTEYSNLEDVIIKALGLNRMPTSRTKQKTGIQTAEDIADLMYQIKGKSRV